MENQDIFVPKPTLILVVYKVYDEDFDKLKKSLHNKILFFPDMPDSAELQNLIQNQEHTILALDDVQDLTSNQFYTDLFCFRSHHERVTPIILVQHLHKHGKFSNAITANTHSLILFPSPRDQSMLLSVGRQLGQYGLLKAIFNDIVQEGNYRYLIVNCHPTTPRDMRFLTNILKSDKRPLTAYIQK